MKNCLLRVTMKMMLLYPMKRILMILLTREMSLLFLIFKMKKTQLMTMKIIKMKLQLCLKKMKLKI